MSMAWTQRRRSAARARSGRPRRARLALALLAVAATAATGVSPATATDAVGYAGRHRSLDALAAEAYVWGYPLVVTERTLQSLALRAPQNRLTFQPARSNIDTRTVVAPNTDTLYAVAPLDVRGEPYVLTLPEIHDRYYSFQFVSAYTDSFAYVGTRATDGRAGRWAITPPGWHGRLPAGVTRIESPTPQLLLLGRFRVVDDADVANVHALATRITLTPLSTLTGQPPAPAPPPFGPPAGTPQSVPDAGASFFDELGDALAANPPVDRVERRTLRRFAALGIGPGRHPTTELHDRRKLAALAHGVTAGNAGITAAAATPGTTNNGWSYRLDVGTYGHNALLRAIVAQIGWGANIAAEAVYAHSVADATRTPYTGAHRYVLHFPPGGLPPVDAFWSVTLYGPDHFFTANPIDRYAISDHTPGLRYGPDGSLDIYIQHDPPAGHESNWLPAPTGGFYLSMRLYLPKPAVLEEQYQYPVVRAVDEGA
jgi:hypothetical protein